MCWKGVKVKLRVAEGDEFNDFILARGQVEEQEDHVEADDADDEVIRRLKHSVEHLTSQSEEQLFCLTLLRGLLNPVVK